MAWRDVNRTKLAAMLYPDAVDAAGNVTFHSSMQAVLRDLLIKHAEHKQTKAQLEQFRMLMEDLNERGS